MVMDEKSCADLLSQLVAKSIVDIIPILGSDEYATLEKLVSRSEEYLTFSGGRVTSHELQSYLNIDMHHIDKIIQKMAAGDTLQLTSGELITQDYLDSLVVEIAQLVQRHQRKVCVSELDTEPSLSIGMLATHFSLPLDTLTALVKTHFPRERCFFAATSSSSLLSLDIDKKCKKKRERKTVSSTTADSGSVLGPSDPSFSQMEKASIYGFCLGAVRPVPLSVIVASTCGLDDEAAVARILQSLTAVQTTVSHTDGSQSGSISDVSLPGVCNNKEYIPHIFAAQQRTQVDDIFRSNNFISFSFMHSLHIGSKHLEYVSESFKDAIALDSCIISKALLDVFITSVADVTSAFPFAAVSSGGDVGADASPSVLPPWLNLDSALPSAFTALDISALFKAATGCSGGTTHSTAMAAMTIATSNDENYIFNRQFLQFLKEVVVADAASPATSEAMAIAASSLHTMKAPEESHESAAKRSSGGGLLSISTAPTSGSRLKSDKSEKHDDNCEGTSGGKRGKTKKIGKSSKLSAASETQHDDTFSKSSKKGSKRGKERDIEKLHPSDELSRQKVFQGSTKTQPTDVTAQLISPFVSKTRIITLLLESCPSGFPEVEEVLSVITCDKGQDFNFADDSYDGTILALIEAVYEDHVHHTASKAYSESAERAILSSSQGSQDTRMKREQSRDEHFEKYWMSLQVASKVLVSFEKDCTPETPLYDQLYRIHALILASKCAPIASMLTEFCCWEHDVDCPVVCGGSVGLTVEQRRQLQKDLPQDIGNMLARLWKSLGVHDNGSVDLTATVGGFTDLVSSAIFRDSFNLVVRKVDKKKEKSVSFAYKQSLMDALKPERDVGKACPLVLSLAVYKLTSSVLELPADVMAPAFTSEIGISAQSTSQHPVVSFLVAWLRTSGKLSPEDVEAIDSLVCATTALSADDEAVDILEAAKFAVLKK